MLNMILAAILLLSLNAQLIAAQDLYQALDSYNLKTFASYIKKSNLTSLLVNGGVSYTLFAPTDEAFNKLSPSTSSALMNNKGLLDKVIAYHVFLGLYPQASVQGWAGGSSPATLEGSTIKVSQPSIGTLELNNASIVASNADFKNGNAPCLMHELDTVLIPPDVSVEGTISQVLLAFNAMGQYRELTRYFNQYGNYFTSLLNSTPPQGFTLLIPIDVVFTLLLHAYKRFPLRGLAKKQMKGILLYNILNGTYSSDDLQDHVRLPSLDGNRLVNVTRAQNSTIKINYAYITHADIPASNGIIHVIDRILIPNYNPVPRVG